MKQTYLMPMARNILTQQTLQAQDLTGYKYSLAERHSAQLVAQRLSSQLSDRTGDPWQPMLRSYTI